jgi:hypothetical protein
MSRILLITILGQNLTIFFRLLTLCRANFWAKEKIFSGLKYMQTRTLANGAVAEVLPTGRLRFISGASKEYLDSIRTEGPRGPNKRPSSRSPSVQYMVAKLKAERGYNRRGVLTDIARPKAGRKLDPRKPRDARLIRKEGSFSRYDVLGIDDGRDGVPVVRYPISVSEGGRAVVKTLPRNKLRMTKAVFCTTADRAAGKRACTYRTYAVAPKSPAQLAAARASIQIARDARLPKGTRRPAVAAPAPVKFTVGSRRNGTRWGLQVGGGQQVGGGYWW